MFGCARIIARFVELCFSPFTLKFPTFKYFSKDFVRAKNKHCELCSWRLFFMKVFHSHSCSRRIPYPALKLSSSRKICINKICLIRRGGGNSDAAGARVHERAFGEKGAVEEGNGCSPTNKWTPGPWNWGWVAVLALVSRQIFCQFHWLFGFRRVWDLATVVIVALPATAHLFRYRFLLPSQLFLSKTAFPSQECSF